MIDYTQGGFDILSGEFGDTAAFKIRFVPLTTGNQGNKNQKGRGDQHHDAGDDFEVGEMIKGKNSEGHTFKGKIIEFKNNPKTGDTEWIYIYSEKADKRVALNPSTCEHLESYQKEKSRDRNETTSDRDVVSRDKYYIMGDDRMVSPYGEGFKYVNSYNDYLLEKKK